MEIIEKKKGFTLIELLAVIVVLAIVAIVGYSTILPLLGNARRNAFLSEANYAVDATSRAVSLIQLGSMKMTDAAFANSTVSAANANGNYKYCFAIADLATAGLYSKEEAKATVDPTFKGKIVVDTTGNGYTYTVTMTNGEYKIAGVQASALKLTSVDDVPTTDSTTYTCTSTDIAIS